MTQGLFKAPPAPQGWALAWKGEGQKAVPRYTRSDGWEVVVSVGFDSQIGTTWWPAPAFKGRKVDLIAGWGPSAVVDCLNWVEKQVPQDWITRKDFNARLMHFLTRIATSPHDSTLTNSDSSEAMALLCSLLADKK